VFRLGDRVIVGKNNYQTECFNGETGQIVDLGPRRLMLRMDDTEGERRVDYDRDVAAGQRQQSLERSTFDQKCSASGVVRFGGISRSRSGERCRHTGRRVPE
jgi:hypothetical protein